MLYNRAISLVVGAEGGKGRELRGLRIAFSIQKGSTKTPNKCSVRIWNLSSDTRAQVEPVGNVVLLRAGYSEDVGEVLIFAGNVERSLTSREGADWVTELELRDGAAEFKSSKVSASFAPGATTTQVLRFVAAKFGLPIRQLPADIASRQYRDGFAFVGRTREAMDRACAYAGLEWSIQNREIQIVEIGAAFRRQAFLLSPDTGLIGSPEQEEKTMTDKAAAKDGITANQPGVRVTTARDELGNVKSVLKIYGFKVKSLLLPTLEPGALVKLKSKGVDGALLRVEELTHSGDTHAGDWTTEITLRYPKNG